MARVLAEPVLRFWALLGVIPKLEAQAEQRAVMIAATGAHPGEKGEVLRDFLDSLSAQAGTADARPVELVQPGITPGVTAVERGEIAALRTEQMARAEAVRREWLERLGRKTD